MMDGNTSTPNSSLPPPPVPQRLREMLEAYPGHIDRLQEVLNNVVQDGRVLLMPFDQAIWALEGRLETFYREAQTELKTAQEEGEPGKITRASEKVRLMSRASSKYTWITDDALWRYFQHK